MKYCHLGSGFVNYTCLGNCEADYLENIHILKHAEDEHSNDGGGGKLFRTYPTVISINQHYMEIIFVILKCLEEETIQILKYIDHNFN
jgi:hypothetical protein